MEMKRTFRPTSRDEWRSWLEEHHGEPGEVWVLFAKKHTGLSTISYDESVEEALCFGWIDSIKQRVDDDFYAFKFTPRKTTSRWSESNLKRLRKLIENNRMTQSGMAVVPEGLLEGKAPEKIVDTTVHEPPSWIVKRFRSDPVIWEAFEGLTPSQQSLYVRWIAAAKRDATQSRRLDQAMNMLKRGEKLGLK